MSVNDIIGLIVLPIVPVSYSEKSGMGLAVEDVIGILQYATCLDTDVYI